MRASPTGTHAAPPTAPHHPQERAKEFHLLGDADSFFPALGTPGLQVHVKAHASQALAARLELAFKTIAQQQQQQGPGARTSAGVGAPSPFSSSSAAAQGGVFSKAPSGRRRSQGQAAKEQQQQQQQQQQQLAFLAAHCFHGFGANLYSYAGVQSALAKALGGVATSHDMPGFGLTQRCAAATTTSARASALPSASLRAVPGLQRTAGAAAPAAQRAVVVAAAPQALACGALEQHSSVAPGEAGGRAALPGGKRSHADCFH